MTGLTITLRGEPVVDYGPLPAFAAFADAQCRYMHAVYRHNAPVVHFDPDTACLAIHRFPNGTGGWIAPWRSYERPAMGWTVRAGAWGTSTAEWLARHDLDSEDAAHGLLARVGQATGPVDLPGLIGQCHCGVCTGPPPTESEVLLELARHLAAGMREADMAVRNEVSW